MVRRIFAAAVGAALVLGLAAPAGAHTELTATNPADGATVTSPLTEVTLTFAEAVRGDGASVVVTGPGGATFHQGAATVLDTTVHQGVASLVSGVYTVDWRVAAADGDPMTGQFTFTLALPTPSPTATAEPTPSEPVPSATAGAEPTGGVVPVGLIALGVLLVVAVVAGLVVAFNRRRP